jgi:hypothetical protein
VRLVTLACNIGLFTMGADFAPVPQLARPGRWLNYYSPRDMLGYPLRFMRNLEHVEDHEVSLGGWFRGWTGLAHTLYWTERKLWAKRIPADLGI